MMNNPVAIAKPVDPEKLQGRLERQLDRTDKILDLWAMETRGARDVAAAALKSGEVQRIGDAMGTPATDRELSIILSDLLASFPRRETDLAIFQKNLLSDVKRRAPSAIALAGAARDMRASRDYLPSIHEILEAVDNQKAACAARAMLLARVPRKIAELDARNNFATDGK